MNKKRLKITVQFYDKKISTQVGRSDLNLEELHELWVEIVKAMGYNDETIKEQYDD